MWELDQKEGWVLKNWYIQTVVLEKTLENPLDSKEIKPVNPKGTQSWIFIERTDAETEALILWPPGGKSWLTGKDSDAGKDWRQKKWAVEDEMVRQHHWLNGYKSDQTPGGSGGQGSLEHDLATDNSKTAGKSKCWQRRRATGTLLRLLAGEQIVHCYGEQRAFFFFK